MSGPKGDAARTRRPDRNADGFRIARPRSDGSLFPDRRVPKSRCCPGSSRRRMRRAVPANLSRNVSVRSRRTRTDPHQSETVRRIVSSPWWPNDRECTAAFFALETGRFFMAGRPGASRPRSRHRARLPKTRRIHRVTRAALRSGTNSIAVPALPSSRAVQLRPAPAIGRPGDKLGITPWINPSLLETGQSAAKVTVG